MGQSLLDQHLGVRSGDQGMFAYFQRQRPELAIAQQMGHRLALLTARR